MLAFIVAVSVASAGPTELKCGGPYVPPTEFDQNGRPVEIEYAVGLDRPGAPPDVVGRRAIDQLVSNICRLADPASCDPLRRGARIWSLGNDTRGSCAMAVMSPRVLDEWRRSLDPDLPNNLRRALLRFFPREEENVASGSRAPKKRKSVVVLLRSIDDNGAPGGVRAGWLLGQVRATLTELDVDMVDPPKGWDGIKLPRGVEYELTGTLVERVTVEGQPVLDVTFTLRTSTLLNLLSKSKTTPPFSIPAAVAPTAPKKVPPPPPETGLALHVETRAGGSLCAGDFTQIHLTNTTDGDLYVRVINLDAAGEALVLFPNEVRVDDLVKAGQTVTLSPDGFTIEGGAGGRERYVAIGARTREGLGRFRDSRGTCRYNPADAKMLAVGRLIEATFSASAGFTLLDDVRCKKPWPLPDPQLIAASLADIPFCAALER